MWKKVMVWLTLGHWVDPTLVRSIWERWTPPPPHFSHSFCARAPSQQAGAPIPHSYMIYNRKPLSGADNFFIFQVLVPPSTCNEKMPPRAAARFPNAKDRHWLYM